MDPENIFLNVMEEFQELGVRRKSVVGVGCIK